MSEKRFEGEDIQGALIYRNLVLDVFWDDKENLVSLHFLQLFRAFFLVYSREEKTQPTFGLLTFSLTTFRLSTGVL